jgi:hypothetical protein
MLRSTWKVPANEGRHRLQRRFQAFPQDVVDAKQYPKLEMPVLGLAAFNYEWLGRRPSSVDFTHC